LEMKFIIFFQKLIKNKLIIKRILMKNERKSSFEQNISNEFFSFRHSPQEIVLNKIKTLETQVQTIQSQVIFAISDISNNLN
jgi:hypothetical protein